MTLSDRTRVNYVRSTHKRLTFSSCVAVYIGCIQQSIQCVSVVLCHADKFFFEYDYTCSFSTESGFIASIVTVVKDGIIQHSESELDNQKMHAQHYSDPSRDRLPLYLFPRKSIHRPFAPSGVS